MKKYSRLAYQSYIILHIFTNFWVVNYPNVLIYVYGKSIPSTYQILFSYPLKPQYSGFVN